MRPLFPQALWWHHYSVVDDFIFNNKCVWAFYKSLRITSKFAIVCGDYPIFFRQRNHFRQTGLVNKSCIELLPLTIFFNSFQLEVEFAQKLKRLEVFYMKRAWIACVSQWFPLHLFCDLWPQATRYRSTFINGTIHSSQKFHHMAKKSHVWERAV